MVTAEEGKILLTVARSVIESHLYQKPFHLSHEVPLDLLERRGAFVTLNTGGQLRGCIGRVEPSEPLIQTVSRMALEAAFNDPRFLPIQKEEWSAVSVEVSVLSSLTKVKTPKEVQVGRDGLLIQRGFTSGLLLPQVATENHWTREEFLMHTCLKAGLPADAWKKEATDIYTFTAEIFSEREGDV